MASFTERLRARGVSDGSPTFTERISKRIEEDRAIQARREKLAQYWGTGISSLNNETTNSPALTASDMAEQARREQTLTNLSQEPLYKPLINAQPPKEQSPIINMFDSDKTGGYLANKAISGLYSVTEGLKASQNMLKPQNQVFILGDIQKQRSQDITDRLYQERAELEQAGQEKSGFVRTIGNLTEGATGMIPTMALSGMSGGVMGVPFVMSQASGNAYTQARQAGATHEQALKYGLASGATEGVIEGIIGGIPGMKGIADPLVDAATRGIKSNLLRGAARVGLDAAGEGIEEVLSTAINPYLQRATYNPEAKNASSKELAGSFGMGAALSGILGGGQSLINARLNRPTLQQAPIQQQTQQAPIQTQPTTQNQQTQQQAVKNTPELRALPEAKQYLMLEAPKMRTPDVIEALPPKPETGTLAEVATEPIHPRFPNTTFSSEPNKLYREVGPDRLLAYVDNIAYDAPYGAFPHELYVTKSPELALGQGTNRGIMLQFSDENVPLVWNTKIAFNPENGEYLVDAGTRDARDNMIPLRHNLEKVTINKDLLGDITQADLDLSKQYAINKAQLNRVTIPTFEARGWKKSFDVEGNLILTNPKLQKAKEIYETAEQNIIHTVPEQYRRETPFTVFRSSEPPKVQSQYAREVFTPIGGESARNVAKSADIPPIGGKVETPQGMVYGEIPKGEIPEGMRERGFSQNIRTDAAMNEDIRASFDENPEVYKQLSNQKTLEKAQEIFNKGQAEAEADFYQSISSNSFRPADVPLAKMLAQQAAEQGDIGKARQILSSIAEKLTEAGQFSQAAKILREADPETFLMTMDKQLKKLNEQGRKKYGKKWKNIDLLPNEITAIKNIPRGNQQAYEEVQEQIGQRIAKQLPSTGMEKFDAWRRIAMLLNPKTHIRNVGGNVIMMGMRKASDTIGAALQKAFVPKGQRTQSVGWSLNKDIVAKVNDNWNTVKKDLLGESRWEIDNLRALGREKQVFKKGLVTKAAEKVTGKQFERGALQWVNELSLKTLNAEDNIFTERAYKDALGQYLQANNMTEVTSEAIEYAKRRALEATFKQANMLADFINKAKKVPVAGFFVEGAIPFTQTPANIVMRGIEYSPGGIIKALYDIKAGKTAATVIEDLSKGLTGSAIMALGFWLSSIGWAKVNRKRSDKAEALYQELGDQRYAINTPLGSYTFDWAQPFSIPLAMGIAAAEALKNRKDGDTLVQAVWDGIMAGGDTVFNMTMLQNVRNILGTYGSPTEKIMGIPLDYLEQAIASVLGQTARTIDPVKRSTYDPNPTKQWLNTVKARVPGLSQKLEPALNIWGQEQSQGGALQQFISPGYFRARSDDPVTNEMARLYESVNNNDILPKTAPNNFTKDKVAYTLTPEQKTEFARIMGQKNYNDLARLFTSSEYKELTDEQRAKRVKSIVESNYDEAKGIIIGGAK